MMLGMILEFVSDYVFRFFRMRAIVKPTIFVLEERDPAGRDRVEIDLTGTDPARPVQGQDKERKNE
jgi:hypothetical protein